MEEIKCSHCNQILPNDAKFCSNCGEKIVNNNIINETVAYNKKVKSTAIKLSIALCLILAIFLPLDYMHSLQCDYKNCKNQKLEGKNYCYDHACQVDNCGLSKIEDDTYCFLHVKDYTCEYIGCDNVVYYIGDFCYEHICIEVGCINGKVFHSDYCSEHKIDMRTIITDVGISFTVNSAGGIEFTFKGRNATLNDIKYIRFNVYLKNAVGDLIEDEITNSTYVPVEIIGKIYRRDRFTFGSEIIGYADNCARIDINDITIIYMDGTSQTGYLGYYCEE